jgi:FixJ family two-component response regulator
MISIIDDDVCAREATAGVVRSLGYAFATYASAEDFLVQIALMTRPV